MGLQTSASLWDIYSETGAISRQFLCVRLVDEHNLPVVIIGVLSAPKRFLEDFELFEIFLVLLQLQSLQFLHRFSSFDFVP